MHVRILLIVGIVLGMHSSLCTGGVFTIASELSVSMFSNNIDAPMSFGSIGYLSCKDNALETNDISETSSRCDDASACLLELSARSREVLSMVHATLERVALPHIRQESSPLQTEISYYVSYREPHYPYATKYSHILLKRE